MTWERAKIGELLLQQPNKKVVQQGWSPKCHTYPAGDGQWGVLKTTAIQPGRFEPTHNKELPSSLLPRPHIEVQPGDLLITCAGPRSRCGIPALVRSTPRNLMMSGKMYRLRPNQRIDPRFLELYLLSDDAQKRIDEMKTGISDSGLNLTHGRFVELPVPVPPLEEQLRIVATLEDHLSHLDAADTYLSIALRRLDALERSALETLFSAAVGTVPLGELVEGISAGKSFGSSNAPASFDEWGIIKVSAMTWGEFRAEENKAVPADRVDPRFEIRKGDLLVSRANTAEYVGASVLVNAVRPRLLLSDKSLRLTPKSHVHSAWLWRALQAPSARKQMTELATGTKDSMRNISQDALRKVQLPKHDREAQEQAVEAFSEVSSYVDSARLSIETQQRRSAALRRSLLAAAFSGRLTGASSEMSVAAGRIEA